MNRELHSQSYRRSSSAQLSFESNRKQSKAASHFSEIRDLHYKPISRPYQDQSAPQEFYQGQRMNLRERAEQAQGINEMIELHTKRWGGSTKRSFKPFYTNIRSNMCYAEDIFHARCNHWAVQPRIYHKCGVANQRDYHYTCSERKTTCSTREDSLCKKCEFDPEKAFRGKDRNKDDLKAERKRQNSSRRMRYVKGTQS